MDIIVVRAVIPASGAHEHDISLIANVQVKVASGAMKSEAIYNVLGRDSVVLKAFTR